MRCKLAIAAVLVMLVGVVGPAHALGFGDIRVESALNQPLRASFPLLGVKPEEQDDIVVRVASRATFERFGIERVGILDEVELVLSDSAEKGGLRVRMRSTRSIREPFLTFLVEANWSGRRALREYTILLDPPASAPSGQAPPTEAAPPVPAGAEFDTAAASRPELQTSADTAPTEPLDDEPVAEAEPDEPAYREEPGGGKPASVADGPRRIGPIQPNQTLWSLASDNRPAGSVTMDQMLVALYRSNPQAFDGNMNLMLEGATLFVPSLEDIRAISRREATQLVAEQRRAFKQLGGSSSQTRVADGGSPDTGDGAAGQLRLEAAEESAGDDANATRVATPESSGSGADDTGEALGALAATADDNAAAADEPARGDDDAATVDEESGDIEDSEPAAGAQSAVADGADADESPGADDAANEDSDDQMAAVAGDDADAGNTPATDAGNGDAVDEPVDDEMVAGLADGTDESTDDAASSAADGDDEVVADGETNSDAEAGSTAADVESGNKTAGNAGAGDAGNPASDAASENGAPITPVESVVPDSAADLFTARQLLLALAGLLLVVALFAYLRRRQYKPMPADFSGLDQDEPPDVTAAATPAAAATAAAATAPEPAPEPAPDVEEVLADARFHEENELYDEALSVLAMGREHHPDDPRLQDRTLAVLHAAGERDAFVADARNIFPHPDPDEERWRETAAMGRELAPDEDSFADVPLPASRLDAASPETDFAANTRVAGEPADGLSEPADAPHSWLTPAAAAAPGTTEADDGLDDDLTPSTDEEFEAMLASFDAGNAPGPAAETPPRESESAPATNADIDLDPDQFDFELDSGSTVEPAAGDDASLSDSLAFDIGDLSVDESGQTDAGSSDGWLGETGATERQPPEAAEGGFEDFTDPFAESDPDVPVSGDGDMLDDGVDTLTDSPSTADDDGMPFDVPDPAEERPAADHAESHEPVTDESAALDLDLDEDWRPTPAPASAGEPGTPDGDDAPAWPSNEGLSLTDEPAWPDSSTDDATADQPDVTAFEPETAPDEDPFQLDDEFDLDAPLAAGQGVEEDTGADSSPEDTMERAPAGETPDDASADDPFGTASAPEAVPPAAVMPDTGGTAASPDDATGPIDDDMALDTPAGDAGGEDLAIQLDLARAYLDMGEPDMAGSLLEEVRDQGTADQRREAEDLLKRL